MVAKYGVEEKDTIAENALLTSLPLDQAKALRSAEEQLVAEHSKRVAHRKSKIALRHAEDFQSLTQDYDRRIAELLSDRSQLEGDLSVEPSRFEKDMDNLEVRSVQLEAEKASSVNSTPASNQKSVNPSVELESPFEVGRAEPVAVEQLPSRRMSGRALTSTPRTPTSIPRGVPFPGNRNSPQATAQPSMPRTPTEGRRTTSDRYPTVAQRTSLVRPDSTPDGQEQKRPLTASPKTSETPATPEHTRAGAARDFGFDHAAFDQRMPDDRPAPNEKQKPNEQRMTAVTAATEAMNKPLERAKTESPKQKRKPSPARSLRAPKTAEASEKRSSRNFSSSSFYKRLFKSDKGDK